MADILQNPHRMFIQIMMGKKIMSSEEVRRVHRLCNERNGTQTGDLKIFVEKINTAINFHNMTIKKGKDEITGEEYYVLINTADNDMSRLNAEYKPKELELFKRIIIDIVESEDGKVSSSRVLNHDENVKISKRDVADIVVKFTKDGWLLEKDGSIFFSTRAIVELEHFLLSHYGELVSRCTVCKNIVLQGISCISCDKKIHHHCKQSYFSQIAENNACPECNEQFE